jgi:hypothetical protein
LQNELGAQRQAVPVSFSLSAGWSERDSVALEKHAAEVEAPGIRRPASTPIFDRVASAQPIAGSVIEVIGKTSGGAVEYAGRKIAHKYQTTSLSVLG